MNKKTLFGSSIQRNVIIGGVDVLPNVSIERDKSREGRQFQSSAILIK